jgi:hypothetical protein
LSDPHAKRERADRREKLMTAVRFPIRAAACAVAALAMASQPPAESQTLPGRQTLAADESFGLGEQVLHIGAAAFRPMHSETEFISCFSLH